MNSTSSEFYRINHVIDGMTLHNGKLYWTDSLAGSISSLAIDAQPRTHQVLITGLDKPRAIVVTDRCCALISYILYCVYFKFFIYYSNLAIVERGRPSSSVGGAIEKQV